MARLWDTGIVALDANALLNVYRYTRSTRDDFLSLLSSFGDRLWLPRQAAQEFHENRLKVMSDLLSAPTVILDGVTKAKNVFSESTGQFRYHPELDATALRKEFADALAPLVGRLEDVKRDADGQAAHSPLADQLLDRITNLFRGKIGGGFEEQDLETIYKEGVDRYSRRIPPGYKDAEKPEPRRYGDLVIWKEILRKAAESSMPMILVTDDRKEDWWWEHQGKTIGPRVELVTEFAAQAGQRIHLYSPEAFLRVANERDKSSVSSNSIDEAEGLARQEQERARAALEATLAAIEMERGQLAAQLASGQVLTSDAAKNLRHLIAQIDEEDYRGESTTVRLRDRLKGVTSQEEELEVLPRLRREMYLAQERSERRAELTARLERTSVDGRLNEARSSELLERMANLDVQARDLARTLRQFRLSGAQSPDDEAARPN
ncbi:MAG: hypothetical protein BGO38_15685 [Cellulomonas sp. 73-145]|nr:DUF4935 domain-containing protein [Cellulomonas sp.]OJV58801.1 MAG: hypothetical protein BGO38_15685 [Cellulomonas sp. 73-145]